jgi:hypothetical protein
MQQISECVVAKLRVLRPDYYQVEAVDEGNALGPLAPTDTEVSVWVVPLVINLCLAINTEVAPAARHKRL